MRVRNPPMLVAGGEASELVEHVQLVDIPVEDAPRADISCGTLLRPRALLKVRPAEQSGGGQGGAREQRGELVGKVRQQLGLPYAELFLLGLTDDDEKPDDRPGGIAQPNEASVGLHEAMGFALVGTYRQVGRKFGRFWDVAIYERPVGAGP